MRTSTLPRQELKRLLASQSDVRAWIDKNGCLIIGVGMLKGGTGKTTMTIFIALYLSLLLDLKVCVVDTDDNSQSVDNWYKVREQRGEEVPFSLVTYNCNVEDGPDLDDVIEQLTEGYDVIIVDSGGAGKEAYWEICQSAHMVLLPLAPSGFEYNRIPATVKQAARGGKANDSRLQVFICLVKCSRTSTLRAEGRDAIDVILETDIDDKDLSRIDLHFVGEEFEISGSPEYSRAWSETPKRTHLEEVGLLFRHAMKEVAA